MLRKLAKKFARGANKIISIIDLTKSILSKEGL
jgi:hypothetical protein